MKRWMDKSWVDMGGVIFPEEELLLSSHFTTEGPGAICHLMSNLTEFNILR